MKKILFKINYTWMLILMVLLSGLFSGCSRIILPDFPVNGYILDIGGGGEGVIGQLKGDKVISIDINEEELINAPSRNLKILMDARDLKFIDNSFNTAVIFFTLMYIKEIDHEKVFREVYRVLNPGGRLLIWDVNLPGTSGNKSKRKMYFFRFILPDTKIFTGYGARTQNKIHDLQYYIDLAEKTGFKVISSSKKERTFYLELQSLK